MSFKIHLHKPSSSSSSSSSSSNLKLYILENDEDLNFVNTVDLLFPLYKTKGIKFRTNSKLRIIVSLQYIFENLSPDYYLQILENDLVIYSERNGLADYPNSTNKLVDEIITDVGNFDNLKIRLVKNDLSTNHICIKKNSYISFEQL